MAFMAVRALGVMDTAFTKRGHERRRMLGSAFGLVGVRLWKAAIVSGSAQFQMNADLARMAARDLQSLPPPRIEGIEHVAPLLASDRPFLIALGHFSYAATLQLLATIDRDIAVVSGTPLMDTRDPLQLRARFHNWDNGRPAFDRLGVEYVYVNEWAEGADVNGAMKAVRYLRKPGHALAIWIDPPREAPDLTRPFAACTAWPFAEGSVRIARAARCPVVFVSAVREGRGRTVVRWHPPVEPAQLADLEGASSVFSDMVDLLEREVGHHPGAYLLDLGFERRWDSEAERWMEDGAP